MNDSWKARYAGALMNTFGPPKLALVRGQGAHVWDEAGNEYVDLLGGIAVNALGHGHPALVAAVTTQLQTLGHVSNFFTSPPQVELAEKLLELVTPVEEVASAPPLVEEVANASPLIEEVANASPLVEEVASVPPLVEEVAQQPSRDPGRVFFTNSGTEANEAAFKITRRTGRTEIIAATESFHGRTMGSLALTSKAAYREPFEPLPGDVTFVPYGDVDALAAAVTDRTAAVILEPLQGEAGVMVPPAGYLAAARRITAEHGALLWLDEIQTGIGRTGQWFAAASDPAVAPDLVTVAKGLAGGFPIGACIALGDAAFLLEPGNHGTTFGGNPPACAAALAVIATIEADGLLERATVLGEKLRDGLRSDPRVVEARGEGLLIGLTLTRPVGAEVAAAALAAGYIVNNATPERIRLAPPLVLTDADANAFLGAWPAILDAAYEGVTA